MATDPSAPHGSLPAPGRAGGAARAVPIGTGARVRHPDGTRPPSGPGACSGATLTGHGGSATVARSLRLGGGIAAVERASFIGRLDALDRQLARYAAGAVELELSIKGRGTRGQRLTLECWIAGTSRLVATSGVRDLGPALSRVREGMRRQLDDAATRREPRNNRRLRRSGSGSDLSSAGENAAPGGGRPHGGDAGSTPVGGARQHGARRPGSTA